MPILTRVWIKTALVYFILSLTLGIFLVLDTAGLLALPVPGLFPSYIHFLVLGWVTQLIMGVAFWMFPKYSQQQPRRSESMGWVSYYCLNLGLILRLVGEPLNAATQAAWAGWIMAIAAGLLLVGGTAFVVNTWGRVKEK